MGVFQKIGKGVKALFGQTTLNAGEVFNTLAGKMDDWKFTEEEKAKYNKDMADAMASFANAQLTESTDRAIARRNIAHLIIYSFLFICLLGVVFLFIDIEKTKLLIEFSDKMYLTTSFITVIAFYFGGYYLSLLKGVGNSKDAKKD